MTTLTSSQFQCFFQGEAVCVECLADDGGVDAFVDELRNGGDIIQGADATGGDDWGIGCGGYVAKQIDVRALQSAVLADIGDDETCSTFRIEALENLPEVASVGDPAAAAQAPVALFIADVQADSDAVTIFSDDLAAPFWVLQRCGTNIDATAASGQGCFEGFSVADTAGELLR